MDPSKRDIVAAKAIRYQGRRLVGCVCHAPFVDPCYHCLAVADAIAAARAEGRREGWSEAADFIERMCGATEGIADAIRRQMEESK